MIGKYQSTKVGVGFTIVELLIVIVIIAILAAITVVAYNGVQARAVKTALQSDLRNAATKVALDKAEKGTYPTDQSAALALFTPAAGTHYEYSTPDGGVTYLMTITSDKAGAPAYCQKSDGSLTEGACPGHSATPPVPIAAIQTITAASCPTTRTVTVDKRDNHTYWVQKLADGKCWMLTDLAYAGGGTNTYGDVKTLTDSTAIAWASDSSETPRYYIPSGTNVTTEPTQPSTSTNGTGQYGYLYNWCGAMGGQATRACTGSVEVNASISVCPANWRLPTGVATTGDFAVLNTAVNSGATNNDSGLRSTWLGQLGGKWSTSFSEQGSFAYYWSSSRYSGNSGYRLGFGSTLVSAANTNGLAYMGHAVRCVAI